MKKGNPSDGFITRHLVWDFRGPGWITRLFMPLHARRLSCPTWIFYIDSLNHTYIYPINYLEIIAHFRSVAEKHGIPGHIIFQSMVQKVEFDESSGT